MKLNRKRVVLFEMYFSQLCVQRSGKWPNLLSTQINHFVADFNRRLISYLEPWCTFVPPVKLFLLHVFLNLLYLEARWFLSIS